MKEKLSTLEEYKIKSMKISTTIIMICCFVGGIEQVRGKLSGTKAYLPLWVVSAYSCLMIAEIIGIMGFGKLSVKNGYLVDKNYRILKIILAFTICVNSIALVMMSDNISEAYYGMFGCVVLLMFYLDQKLMIISNVILMIGILALPFVNPQFTVPQTIMPMIILFFIIAVCFVRVINTTLVIAKEDKIRENERRLQVVINKVARLIEHLSEAILSLSAISQEENANMVEINSSSEVLNQNI